MNGEWFDWLFAPFLRLSGSLSFDTNEIPCSGFRGFRLP